MGGGTLSHGLEDGRISLQGLIATLSDADGSESLVLTLTGMPIGSVLSDGVHSFTASATQHVANLAGWNIGALALTPPSDFAGSLSLQVMATAIETSTAGRATATLQLEVQVVAVADAPILTLTARDLAVSREIASTSWESVRNTGQRATLVNSSTLEGWTVLTSCGQPSQFEIWSTGDSMPNAQGKYVPVRAATGDGNNFLQLNDGSGNGHQTLGIGRTITTIAGAIYTLSFDYAGALGQPQANTRVGIYVNDQLLASYAGTSSLSALNWQALTYQFAGSGGAQRLRIQIEGGSPTANGRGAMIDDIRIVETLPSGNGTIYGLTNTAIALPRIDARLTDTDGSESLKVDLLGLPAGAVVSDGTRSLTIGAASTTLDITAWKLGALSLTPPTGFVGTLQLQVRATSIETSSGATASVTQNLTLHVLSGSAQTTPVGVNPYVTLATGTTVTSSTAPSVWTQPSQPSQPIIVSEPIVSAIGTLQFTAAPAAPRTWEEEEADEQARAQALGDAWLGELEQAAQAHWAQLTGA